MTDEWAEREILNGLQRRKTMLECELVTAPATQRAALRVDIEACASLLEECSDNYRKQREREAKEPDRPPAGSLLH